MKNRRWLWVTAVVITLASAVYQRMSGPTYPVRGSVTLGGESVSLRLTRTHPGAGDQPVVLDGAGRGDRRRGRVAALPDRASRGRPFRWCETAIR